jgi:hypothetical protein
MTLNRFTASGIAVIAFAAGSFFTRVQTIRADSNRVFELRIYHTVPGKVPALTTRFRDIASKLLAKHELKAVGYWIPQDALASDNTFIYILAHPSREGAKANWSAMFADPAFQEMGKMEQTEKLVEKVDSIYMNPTDFSPMK